MRPKKEIREELRKELKAKKMSGYINRRDLERLVDNRYHWERVIAEAEEYEREGRHVKVEFVASPGDEGCKLCWDMNGVSLTLEELKKLNNQAVCRCAIVVPEDGDH
jgi:hypothetical protein